MLLLLLDRSATLQLRLLLLATWHTGGLDAVTAVLAVLAVVASAPMTLLIQVQASAASLHVLLQNSR